MTLQPDQELVQTRLKVMDDMKQKATIIQSAMIEKFGATEMNSWDLLGYCLMMLCQFGPEFFPPAGNDEIKKLTIYYVDTTIYIDKLKVEEESKNNGN